ncbi:MAG: 50S ribosomal protein L6 [Mariprofundaceae bacterium]|nr:50S ribosomal protein L6 [Mariprofundaceae bacterium]
MSRVGKQPIAIPNGVDVKINNDCIIVKGSKGELSSPLFEGVSASFDNATLQISCEDVSNKKMNGNFGLARALAANNVLGVTKGFVKVLELRGVGYRAQVQGQKLNLSLGFSHPVVYNVPAGIDAKIDKSLITISGVDKQRVGQVAAEIRAYRPPEPYKGKGVRYVGEYIAMKEGKKA